MSLLLEHASLLVRGADAYETIEDGCLGIRGGVIDYLGAEPPEAAYDARKDMTGKLVMPGLINCHCHSPMVLLRGKGSGLPLHDWLFDTIFPIESRLTAEEIAAGSRCAVMELLAGGTTSYTDMYFFPEETARVAAETGIRVSLNRLVQCFDEDERPEKNPHIREALALYDRYHGAADGRVFVDFAIHAEYTCKPKTARAVGDLCAERGARMHIHLAETAREQRECVERWGQTPTEWFDALGVFRSPTLAAHCVAVTEHDRAILRERGVSVVHNPTSNLKLGSGFAPVPELLAEGVNVALGTDGAASNNNLNLFEEMHLAAVMHAGIRRDPTALSAAQVLDMATRGGAAAQGRPDTGELAVGKKADLIALDLDKPHLYPNFDTAALVTCSAQAGDVCLTMVDGKILYENGEFTTIDAEQTRAELRAAVRRLYG